MHQSYYAALSLSHAPINSFEYLDIKSDPAFLASLKWTTIYMICQRPTLIFDKVSVKNTSLDFDIVQVGTDKKLACSVPYNQDKFLQKWDSKFQYELCTYEQTTLSPGNLSETAIHWIRIFDAKGRFAEWLSPDKFIYQYGRKLVDAEVQWDYRLFTEFQVLYVWKATGQEVYGRLSAHAKFLEILWRQRPSATWIMPSQEITLLLFRPSPKLTISSFQLDEFNFRDLFEKKTEKISQDAISLDVEKALIQVLNPKYNSTKYTTYPESDDWLCAYGARDWWYQILDDLTLMGADSGKKIICNVLATFSDSIIVTDLKSPEITRGVAV